MPAGVRVAIVDDEAAVLKTLSRLLRLADYEVASYSSGEELLASLQAFRPDCVILDVHMPRLSGFDVQSRLRSSHPGLPALFITASDDPSLDRAASEAGASGCSESPSRATSSSRRSRPRFAPGGLRHEAPRGHARPA